MQHVHQIDPPLCSVATLTFNPFVSRLISLSVSIMKIWGFLKRCFATSVFKQGGVGDGGNRVLGANTDGCHTRYFHKHKTYTSPVTTVCVDQAAFNFHFSGRTANGTTMRMDNNNLSSAIQLCCEDKEAEHRHM